MKDSSGPHYRVSGRLKDIDYSLAGWYFVTFCAQDRDCLFGKIVDGEMVLNVLGKIVNDIWNETPEHFQPVDLDAFIIMPNHVQGIIVIIDLLLIKAYHFSLEGFVIGWLEDDI